MFLFRVIGSTAILTAGSLLFFLGVVLLLKDSSSSTLLSLVVAFLALLVAWSTILQTSRSNWWNEFWQAVDNIDTPEKAEAGWMHLGQVITEIPRMRWWDNLERFSDHQSGVISAIAAVDQVLYQRLAMDEHDQKQRSELIQEMQSWRNNEKGATWPSMGALDENQGTSIEVLQAICVMNLRNVGDNPQPGRWIRFTDIRKVTQRQYEIVAQRIKNNFPNLGNLEERYDNTVRALERARETLRKTMSQFDEIDNHSCLPAGNRILPTALSF